MSMSRSVSNYLCQAHVEYTTLHHVYANSAMGNAESAYLQPTCVVKGVVMRDQHDGTLVMAVVPATHKIKRSLLKRVTGRDLALVSEDSLRGLFPDCALGAVPALGQAYNMQVVWDETLGSKDDLYFEAGDHEELVHLDRAQFMMISANRLSGTISEQRHEEWDEMRSPSDSSLPKSH